MARVIDNYPEVRDSIKAVAASWDFRARGKRRSFGDDALDLVAEGVLYRTIGKQLRPDGQPLARLKQRTLDRKRRLGYPETIGVETGEMLAFEELQGRRQIQRRIAVVDYGTEEENRLKAEWFTEGRRPVQEPRPFFELDREIEASLDRLFEEILERNLRELGG